MASCVCVCYPVVLVGVVCSPKEVEREEYNSFYHVFSKDSQDPIGMTHFSAEGEVSFKAMLFIPNVSEGGVCVCVCVCV